MRTFLLKTMQAMMLFSICILGWLITNFLEEEKQIISVKGEEKPMPFCGNASEYVITDGLDGKALFNANCASCHKRDQILTGPPLMGVEDRWPDKNLLYSWIRNSDSVLKSGNLYANNLFKKYYKVRMLQFPNLTDDEVKAILAFAN